MFYYCSSFYAHDNGREGEQVRISCDEHYELSQDGEAMPRCLSTGEWEVGKTCVPIMCDAYDPPEHGSVFPDTAVMAGQTVSPHNSTSATCLGSACTCPQP
jgi:hypothetical protein